MTRRSCPHCSKPIDVDVTVWDDIDDEYGVELRKVHTWEACSAAWYTRRPACSLVTLGARVGVGGAVCNWLGPTCNDASHVTPVTPRVAFRPGEAVSAALHLFGADGSKSCTYVNTARTRDALWLAPGLARCVHLPEA